MNDTETNIGLRQIYEVINDRDTDTISMTTFYDLARKYGDQLTEDEIRMLLEKTQMGGTNLDFDEFYTIMKGAGRDNSVMNMSRSSFRNKNNNDIYVKKSNNPNISDNNSINNSRIRTKKYIYKEVNKKEVEPEPEPEPEPEQEPVQKEEEIVQNMEEIEQNKEIEYEIERKFDSPKQNYVEEYHEEQIIENQIPLENDNNINNINKLSTCSMKISSPSLLFRDLSSSSSSSSSSSFSSFFIFSFSSSFFLFSSFSFDLFIFG